MTQSQQPRPGDAVVRRPRESEIAPIRVRIQKRTVSVRGPASPMSLVYLFLSLTLAGTFLLVLPIANETGGFTPFLTALFTATSAVTVTGLVVVDTSEFWSAFGEAVILVLFLIGGLGFMTGAAFLLIIVGQSLGLQNRIMIREGMGGGQLGRMTVLVRNIVVVSAGFQVAGTILLFLRFYVFGSLWDGIGAKQALWQSLYNSASAFNNAGFEVMPNDLVGGDNLIPFANDYWTLVIMGALIVIGGLSFAVVSDVARSRNFGRLSLDTKLVLVGSAALLVLGAGLFLAEEWSNSGTLGDRGVGGKLAGALFGSVSARTAGFTTIDHSQTTQARTLTAEVLMFVGGASASTAGGIKINTFMVIVLAVMATLGGKRRVTAFGREIPTVNVQRAMVVGAIAIFTLVFFVAAFTTVQPGVPLRAAVFEVISAFGTVGLSMGVTPELNGSGQVVITTAMFVGRFGPLTLALLMAGREAARHYRLAEERVRIG